MREAGFKENWGGECTMREEDDEESSRTGHAISSNGALLWYALM
jgi:hypothetical protein